MSGLHLSHLLPWKDLIKGSYKDQGIELPTGECGGIHVSNKKTQLQVDHRKYLDDQICHDLECKVTGTKIFRKNNRTKEFTLTRNRHERHCLDPEEEGKQLHFAECFEKAIREFAETERKKVQRNVVNNDCDFLIKETLAKLEEKTGSKLYRGMEWRGCNCELFVLLIENGDAETLLSFSDQEILSVLGCQHGGQAVGNNFRFLEWHILRVFICTNVIFASEIQDSPEKWGCLSPNSNRYCFRSDLMEDCDGQTFLYSSRRFLKDDVYMKDWEAMKQLSKDCFKFLYYVAMIRKEVGQENGWLLDDLKYVIQF